LYLYFGRYKNLSSKLSIGVWLYNLAFGGTVMNLALMEELLNEDESTALDFKRDQYPFAGATDEQKSELLKDILAFANSWRRTDAYILIGVEDIKGSRKNVVGVTDHLDDANIQQFVNTKTQRPITFAYEASTFEGKQVGVIKIALQDRPFYLVKDYGKLKKHEIYIRRGSSTDIAKPDEIAKMGVSLASAVDSPKLNIEFTDKDEGNTYGHSIALTSQVVNYDEKSIPSTGGSTAVAALYGNPNYKRELARWIRVRSLIQPVSFRITNRSGVLAKNVHLVLPIDNQPDLIVMDRDDLPNRPNKQGLSFASLYPGVINSPYRVDKARNQWTVNVKFGNIQPKAAIEPGGQF
jgi:hypothetical protein